MGKFTIRRTDTGFVFALRSRNGEVIAVSEVYGTRASCVKGIQGIIKCVPNAAFAELDGTHPLPPNPRFEIFTDKSGQYRFRLRARNGKVIASSQGYSTRSACENGIESVRTNADAEALAGILHKKEKIDR